MREEEVEETVVVRNQPFVETVHTADFVWPAWARDLAQCPAVWQRRWVTLGYLRAMEEEGIYGPRGGGRSVAELVPTGGDAGRFRESRRALFDATEVTLSEARFDPE